MSSDDSATAAAAVPGRALAAVVAGLLQVRGPRPIHTTGLVLTGVLLRQPHISARSGIAWIDDREPAETGVIARLSRGASVPAPLPDVQGLAVRTRTPDGVADLLLSSTGLGVPGRFLLAPRLRPAPATMSTLMPYRGPDGPVLVAVRSLSPSVLPARMERTRRVLLRTPWVLELLFATPRGRWHRFGTLELAAAPGPLDDDGLRFDPILNPLPGARTYEWTRVLREPSYATGRRGRG